MIRVDRGPAPDGFDARAEDWKARFEQARAEDPSITASGFWRKVRNEIRGDAGVLFNRFCGKCAYCEAKMRHVSYPQIEHYKPKHHPEFEALMFDWDNWLLSCGVCNTKKGHKTDFLDPNCDGKPCLIDPAGDDDPERAVYFKREFIFGLTKRGEHTIRIVGLDLPARDDSRALWLSHINTLLLLTGHQNSEVSAQARLYLIWAMQKDAPYTAMVRSYLRERTPRLAGKTYPPVAIVNIMEKIEHLVAQYVPRLWDLE